VKAVRASISSSLIAIGLSTKYINIWDIEGIKKVRSRKINAVPNDLVFTPDSKKVIIAADNCLKLWDLLSD
jgi:WD40 repeat protein